MRIWHAATLALVGWYLMVPPKELDAPISSRVEFGSYYTAKECEQAREWLAKRIKAGTSKSKMTHDQAVWSECVESDDPRLKP